MAQTPIQTAIKALREATDRINAIIAAKEVVVAQLVAMLNLPFVPTTTDWDQAQSYYDSVIDTLDFDTLHGWGEELAPWG